MLFLNTPTGHYFQMNFGVRWLKWRAITQGYLLGLFKSARLIDLYPQHVLFSSQKLTADAGSIVTSKSREVRASTRKAGSEWYAEITAASVPLLACGRLSFTTQHIIHALHCLGMGRHRAVVNWNICPFPHESGLWSKNGWDQATGWGQSVQVPSVLWHVGWVMEKASDCKNLCHLYQKVLFRNKWWKKIQGNR